MSRTRHVPIPHRRDRLSAYFLTALAGTNLTYGGVFALGGKAESASQLLLKPVLPPTLWGAALVGAAALLWLGHNRSGPVIGVTVWGALAAASGITIAQGTAASYGGPCLFAGLTALHAVILWGEYSGLDEHRKGGAGA